MLRNSTILTPPLPSSPPSSLSHPYSLLNILSLLTSKFWRQCAVQMSNQAISGVTFSSSFSLLPSFSPVKMNLLRRQVRGAKQSRCCTETQRPKCKLRSMQCSQKETRRAALLLYSAIMNTILRSPLVCPFAMQCCAYVVSSVSSVYNP